MTRDEILNMPAGREMDTLIAQKVMGWSADPEGYWLNKKENYDDTGWGLIDQDKTTHHPSSRRFCPSTDIAAAWMVVEKFYSMSLNKYSGGDEWRVYLVTERDGANVDAHAEADTAPLAICRTALLAVGD